MIMSASERRASNNSIPIGHSADENAWVQSTYASPLGLLRIVHNGQQICRLDHLSVSDIPQLTIVPLPVQWQQAFRDYFAGDLKALQSLPVTFISGTPFQQAIWQAIRRIKPGKTATYKDIAEQVGHPRAYQAVGQALRCNPIAIVLPCHRVVCQSGALGGYNGAHAVGQARKHFLLWHEGVGNHSQHVLNLPEYLANA